MVSSVVSIAEINSQSCSKLQLIIWIKALMTYRSDFKVTHICEEQPNHWMTETRAERLW